MKPTPATPNLDLPSATDTNLNSPFEVKIQFCTNEYNTTALLIVLISTINIKKRNLSKKYSTKKPSLCLYERRERRSLQGIYTHFGQVICKSGIIDVDEPNLKFCCLKA